VLIEVGFNFGFQPWMRRGDAIHDFEVDRGNSRCDCFGVNSVFVRVAMRFQKSEQALQFSRAFKGNPDNVSGHFDIHLDDPLAIQSKAFV
jgi:hypothetical protein